MFRAAGPQRCTTAELCAVGDVELFERVDGVMNTLTGPDVDDVAPSGGPVVAAFMTIGVLLRVLLFTGFKCGFAQKSSRVVSGRATQVYSTVACGGSAALQGDQGRLMARRRLSRLVVRAPRPEDGACVLHGACVGGSAVNLMAQIGIPSLPWEDDGQVRLLVGPAYGPVDFIVYATSPVRASRLECALPLSSTLHIGWPWALDTY